MPPPRSVRAAQGPAGRAVAPPTREAAKSHLTCPHTARSPRILESTYAFRNVHLVDADGAEEAEYDRYSVALFHVYFDQVRARRLGEARRRWLTRARRPQPLYLNGDTSKPFANSPAGIRGKLDGECISALPGSLCGGAAHPSPPVAGVAALECGEVGSFLSVPPSERNETEDVWEKYGWPKMPTYLLPHAERVALNSVPLHLEPLPHTQSPATHFLSVIECDLHPQRACARCPAVP